MPAFEYPTAAGPWHNTFFNSLSGLSLPNSSCSSTSTSTSSLANHRHHSTSSLASSAHSESNSASTIDWEDIVKDFNLSTGTATALEMLNFDDELQVAEESFDSLDSPTLGYFSPAPIWREAVVPLQIVRNVPRDITSSLSQPVNTLTASCDRLVADEGMELALNSDSESYSWTASTSTLHPLDSPDFSLHPSDEVIRFKAGSYRGTSSLLLNATRSTADATKFIRAQSCLTNCQYEFKLAIKPVRLREHLARCKFRKRYFEEREEEDALGRFCELLLISLR
jgi:hypothetical protein